jgi:hypothetical protein
MRPALRVGSRATRVFQLLDARVVKVWRTIPVVSSNARRDVGFLGFDFDAEKTVTITVEGVSL